MIRTFRKVKFAGQRGLGKSLVRVAEVLEVFQNVKSNQKGTVEVVERTVKYLEEHVDHVPAKETNCAAMKDQDGATMKLNQLWKFWADSGSVYHWGQLKGRQSLCLGN
jgi:hypothetical protein